MDYTAEAAPTTVSVFEGRNVAFNGSLCVDGVGIALVIRIGVNTIIGQIAVMTTGQKDKGSELEREVSNIFSLAVHMGLKISRGIFFEAPKNYFYQSYTLKEL